MGTKLFVGNLSYSITEQELREAFGQSGRTVQSVRIALDRETQRPRGFAFVELANDSEADAAIKEMNGTMLAGRSVFIEKAQERAPGAPRPAPRPRPGGFGGPGGPGGPGGFRPGGPRPGPGGPGGYRPGGPPRGRFMASAEVNKEEGRRMKSRPEKKDYSKKRSEGRPEERERGKWRWDGEED